MENQIEKGADMFTGIIEELGKIRSVSLNGNSGRIAIGAKKVLEGTKIGDSIAVNGVCLTVISLQRDGFAADVMAETVRCSNLGKLHIGDDVNLERAMAADGRFGGHLVSGHIDGTGVIKGYKKEENAVWVTIETEPHILTLIIEKGSVCIDGISLTVAEVGKDYFCVSVIPHTGQETTLLRKQPGNMVNLENDMIGKYVAQFFNVTGKEQSDFMIQAQKSNTDIQRYFKKNSQSDSKGLTMEFLKEYL